MSARESEREFKVFKHNINNENFSNDNVKKVHHSNKQEDYDYNHKRQSIRVKNHKPINKPTHEGNVKFNNQITDEKHQAGINKSSDKIHFESNDLLDDYKK